MCIVICAELTRGRLTSVLLVNGDEWRMAVDDGCGLKQINVSANDKEEGEKGEKRGEGEKDDTRMPLGDALVRQQRVIGGVTIH
jgi:hypothetical protein